MTSVMQGMQSLGRSLMLPIAVLPVASLLLRLGQPDLLDIAFVAAAGQAIFANLGLLFAIGVATGFARQGHGAAALAGVVAFFVATKGAEALIDVPPDLLAGLSGAALDAEISAYRSEAMSRMTVPVGILCGLVAGLLYNRYAEIRLPDYLAFFGGRRFVPIAAGLAGLMIAATFGLGWGGISAAMDALSRWIAEAGELGLFLYGVLNRILIVTGLHHMLNNVVWFIVGEYQGATGDLMRFFAGDPSAGRFMSGFFPVMMFGLPAACLAMYHAAPCDRRKATGGMLLSMALTTFLTGVTEPIEFSFMFLSPILYAVHAVLTGSSMALMDILGVKLGFGFSAGLFDYILNFTHATRPLLLLLVGAVYFFLYYSIFRVFIHVFDLTTPGREPVAAPVQKEAGTDADTTAAAGYIEALGGAGNLDGVEACTTRLRLTVANPERVDDAALRALGAKGVLRLSGKGVQVVVGPTAELLAADIRAALGDRPTGRQAAKGNSKAVPLTAAGSDAENFEVSDMEGFIRALGGRKNVKSAVSASNRLCLELLDGSVLDRRQLGELGVRAIADLAQGRIHLLLPRNADRLAASLAVGIG